jgi:hypothetical protein
MQWDLNFKISLRMCFYFFLLFGLDCITGAPIRYHDLMSDPELRQKLSCELSVIHQKTVFGFTSLLVLSVDLSVSVLRGYLVPNTIDEVTTFSEM